MNASTSPSEKYDFNRVCPTLVGVKPTYKLSFKDYEIEEDYGRYNWQSSTSSVADGIEKYSAQDFPGI